MSASPLPPLWVAREKVTGGCERLRARKPPASLLHMRLCEYAHRRTRELQRSGEWVGAKVGAEVGARVSARCAFVPFVSLFVSLLCVACVECSTWNNARLGVVFTCTRC